MHSLPFLDPPVEAWRLAWRNGFAPQLSTAGLEALARALAEDDPDLLHGTTTTPPGLLCLQAEEVKGACAVSYAGWRGEGLATVGQVTDFFCNACHQADTLLGEPQGSRHFLNWWDDAPRDVARAELLTEVRRTLAARRPPLQPLPISHRWVRYFLDVPHAPATLRARGRARWFGRPREPRPVRRPRR